MVQKSKVGTYVTIDYLYLQLKTNEVLNIYNNRNNSYILQYTCDILIYIFMTLYFVFINILL